MPVYYSTVIYIKENEKKLLDSEKEMIGCSFKKVKKLLQLENLPQKNMTGNTGTVEKEAGKDRILYS